MAKIWAAVEDRSSPAPVPITVTGQKQSETLNPGQREREGEGDDKGVNGSGLIREEATPISSASGDLRRWLTTGKHCHIMPWPLGCRRQFNWLRISKIALALLALALLALALLALALLAVAVAARYMIIQDESSVAILSGNNISATPSFPLSKKRRNLNLQLALSQIINPSTHHQIFHSFNVSNQQHPPNITLAALAAFTASCHPHAFTLAIFLSQDLYGAFENQNLCSHPREARAALHHSYKLAVRAARAETKADTPASYDRLIPFTDKFDEKEMKRHHPRCRTRNDISQPSSSPLMTSTHTTQTGKLLDQDAMAIPPTDIAFENQTLYHHLISSPSFPYSSGKKEAAIYHQCEELTDSHHTHTYLAQVVHILEEMYMTVAAAAAVPMEERWAREVRDEFHEWFYERLLRVSSVCRIVERVDDY